MARVLSLSTDKVLLRRCKAIPPLQIRFGSNYIEMKTPLVMLSFCVVQIANMLILTGRVSH